MKKLLKYQLLFFLVLNCFYGSCQEANQEMRIALNYFNKGDFDKAVLYFDKLYSTSNASDIYAYYRITLIKVERYKDAEKLCKNQIKSNPDKFGYLIELGKVYEASDKEEKANGIYDQALHKINEKSTHNQINDLALAFEKEGMTDKALNVYLSGNKYSKNSTLYNQNIAYIYGKQGKTKSMIETYLELIDLNEGYLTTVQRGLENSIDILNNKQKREILKIALLKRSQLNPGKIVYNELLAWYYTSINDFKSGFIQIKAIDKKTNAQGTRLLELGESCYINDIYDVSLRCFDEIIINYPKSDIVSKAKEKRLKALKEQLLSGGGVSKEKLLELKEDYIKTINEIKDYYEVYEIGSRCLSVIRELAELEAYHLHDYHSAETLLKEALVLPGISLIDKGGIKIELADVFVLQSKVWDASLLYMQVEKEFKHDQIGHTAKFNNAKIYYYTGEFNWCQAQLDVLKASTSKLIANDAMELSLLITDNFNLDTTQLTMKQFSKADLLILQNKFDEVYDIYDSINLVNGYHSLNDDMLFRKAKISIKLKLYDKAIDELKELLQDYGDDILADNALFLLGDLYERYIMNIDKAKECYKKILFEHKGSLFVVEARKRFRKLTGSQNEVIKGNS